MASFGLRIVLLATVAHTTRAVDRSISPIYVDIHKREVQGTDVHQYGSFIGVGSPAQNQSLWPSLSRNETSVANVNFCEQSNLPSCLNSTRGNFDAAESSTWIPDQEYGSLDMKDNGIVGPFGQDDIHFYTHYFQTDPASETILPDNPLQIASNATVRPGIVGLGSSSTILQGLADSGKIAGRTYSIYVGSGMDRAGGVINGSLTLGGYDTGRFTGSIYSFPMKEGELNPLAVQVLDVVINDESDSSKTVSLLKDLRSQDDEIVKPFEAKITTDSYPMSFPYKVTQAFKALLSAENSALSDGSLRLQNYFGGSMSIKLSGGFTVTLPNNVMFNETQISPVAEREQNSTEPFLLSLAWLSQVYLMVDIETSKFFLAQAVAENKFITPETFIPGETPKLNEVKESDSFASTGMVGAVIGGVIGGLGIITLIAFLVIIGIRRRNQRRLKCVDYVHAQSQFSVEQDSEKASLGSQDLKVPVLTGREL